MLPASHDGSWGIWQRKYGRDTVFVVCGLAFLVALGCHDADEIRSYKVSKEAQVEESASVPGRVRLLAAILPHDTDTWFFKLVGPNAEVTEHEPTFHRFLQSIHLREQGTDPIAWTVPEGWQYEGPKEFRYCTFRFGTKEKPLELTVFKFAGQAGSTLDNVNRWRGRDLGLEQIGPIQLSRYTKPVQVGDVKGTLVDMSGPGAPKAGMKP
jgi:hypothetical protein